MKSQAYQPARPDPICANQGHRSRRTVDRDRVIDCSDGIRNQIVALDRHGLLPPGGAHLKGSVSDKADKHSQNRSGTNEPFALSAHDPSSVWIASHNLPARRTRPVGLQQWHIKRQPSEPNFLLGDENIWNSLDEP